MRLPWMVWCWLWAWVCRGLPQTETVQENQAQECELYGAQNTSPPVMQFQRRISVGVMPQGTSFTATLVLQSTTTKRTCKLYFISGLITPVCGQDFRPPENFNKSDVTELWIEVARMSGDVSTTTWDLKVVGRQGKYRTHMLIPDTGLQPPVNLWFNLSQSIQYYFNCITGCLLEKSVEMPPGDHTFFLRHDEGFVQMTLDCGLPNYSLENLPINGTATLLGSFEIPKEVNYPMKKLSINVTADELGTPGGLKKVTVVWSKQLGAVGVLVDGVPVGDLIEYEPLKKERQVKVKVSEEGGGLVASCDPHFQKVVCGGDEQVTATTTEPSSTSAPTTYGPTINNPSPQISTQPSSGWLPAVFTFVVLNFIVTVAAVSLAILLYCRSSSETWHFSKGNSDAPAIFSRKSSTRSSTRSGHRGSQRQKTKNDGAKETPESCTGETRANSETVTTPLTTPDSGANSRTRKNLSTDEFVDLSLI